jgi:WD40 repeat protein
MTATTVIGNPFPGLHPFKPGQADLFFGRDGDVRRLFEKLRMRRLVAVVGVSGIGKSSVVAAGLIPRLQEGFMPGVGPSWRIVHMKPGNSAVQALAASVSKSFGLDKDSVLEQLNRSSRGLRQLAATRLSPLENLLIVVDQFEELMRFRPGGQSPAERGTSFQFVDLLLGSTGHGLIEPPGETIPNIFVVLTMRSEYLGKCTKFSGLAEALNEGQFLLPRLGRQQLREIIEAPVTMAGGRISPDLVQQLLNDAADESDELPLLQFALSLMWDQSAKDREQGKPISLAHYQAIGSSIVKSLNNVADDTIRKLARNVDGGERILRELFQRLAEPGRDDEEVRRPTRMSELVKVTSAREPLIRDFTKALSDIGLITVSSDKDPEIDITHESLIRRWTTLTNWIREEAKDADIYQRLARAAARRGNLYSGPDLEEASRCYARPRTKEAWEEWAARYPVGNTSFSDAEEFLKNSRAAAFRQSLFRWIVSGAILALAITASGLGLYSRSLSRTKVSQRLAFQAKELHNGPGGLNEISLLLGIESLKRNESLEADRVIRTILALTPTFVSRMKHEGPVTSLVFSPDSKLLFSGSEDKTFRIWDVASGKELVRQQSLSQVRSLQLDTSGNYLLVLARDGAMPGERAKAPEPRSLIDVWALSNSTTLKKSYGISTGAKITASLAVGKLLMTDGLTLRTVNLAAVLAVKEEPSPKGQTFAFTPDNKLLVVADHQFVHIHDLTSGAVRTLTLPGPRFRDTRPAQISISADGRLLYTLDSLKNKKGVLSQLRRWNLQPPDSSSLQFEVDGDELAPKAASDFVALGELGPSSNVAAWNTKTGKLAGTTEAWPTREGRQWFIQAFSHDGSALVGSAGSEAVQIFRLAPWTESFRIGIERVLSAFAWSQDDRIVALGTADGLITVWKLESTDGWRLNARSFEYSPKGDYSVTEATKDRTQILDRKNKKVAEFNQENSQDYTFSPEEQYLAWISRDKRRFFPYSLPAGRQICSAGYQGRLLRSAFSRSGRFLTVTSDGQLTEWGLTEERGQCAPKGTLDLGKFGPGSFKDGPDWWQVYFSPRADLVAVNLDDRTNEFSIWNVDERRIVAKIRALSFYRLAFSPDGSLVAGNGDHAFICWRSDSGRELWHESVQGATWLYAFDSTGTRIARAHGHVVEVRDSQTGRTLFTTGDKSAEVQAVTFDRSGEYVAGTWSSNRVRIWRIRDGFQTNDIPINVSWGSYPLLTFSPDNTFIVAQDSAVGALDLYRAIWWKREDMLREACKHAAFNLSADDWNLEVRDGRPADTCPGLPLMPAGGQEP